MHEEWLSIVMQHAFSEIYIFDDTLRFLEINRAARDNLQYSQDELAALPLTALVHESARDACTQAMRNLRAGAGPQTWTATHVRKDGSSYPLEMRLMLHAGAGGAPAFIAIGNDLSAEQASAAALGLYESRFQAIVSNTPGLVFQFLLKDGGATSFLYLSDGCQALLGLSAEQLAETPAQFQALILPEDRKSFQDAMAASAASMTSWNWAGRIWVDAWKDIKWINLRATPRTQQAGVQWDGIMTNITQSKLEESEIKQSRARLAELNAHVERIKEQERTRIAREIHDELGGNLTAIKMALALLTRRLPEADETLNSKANYVDALVDRTIEAAHRISLDLRPSMLDLGIVAALEWQTSELEKQLGIPCSFSSNEKDIALHLDQATALFRIFQEALTNIAKHAEATRVVVRLVCTRHHVKLRITDNGRGIDAADRLKPASFGIRGMTERARALGGTVLVTRAQGAGSTVSIKIALKSPQPSDNGDVAHLPQQQLLL